MSKKTYLIQHAGSRKYWQAPPDSESLGQWHKSHVCATEYATKDAATRAIGAIRCDRHQRAQCRAVESPTHDEQNRFLGKAIVGASAI